MDTIVIAITVQLKMGSPDAYPALARARLHRCTGIALAHFSMARARAACEKASGLPVLTTVESAVRTLQARLH